MKFFASIVLAMLATLCLSAEGTSCRRPKKIRNGGYEYQTSADYGITQLPVNYVVRVVCDPDSTLIGQEFIVCQPNGRWSDYPYCHAPMICFVPPENPVNGYVRMRGRSAGSISVYRCNPGFELHGNNIAVCNKTTGRWQGGIPACFRPPSCPAPMEPSGHLGLTLHPNTGIKVGDLYTERTVFNYTCQTGYHPSRDVIITCQDGTWEADADIPECNRITCAPPTLQQIQNGSHDIVNRTYNVGEIVQYECNEGFLVDGISWQVCQENGGPNGIWSDSVPRCKVARCPHPGSRHLDDGRISFSLGERGSTNSWSVGTVMTLSCSSHLELMGSSERVCQLDGHWNGTLTSCTSEEYDCPALGNPIHGYKIGSPDYRVHSSVSFRCYRGYEMIGSEERTCTLYGEWTGEMPRCMGRDEFDEFTRVTNGLGKTFDEMAIDGGFWPGMNESTSNSGGRRKRTIDPSTSGLDIYFAFDASNSVGEANFNDSKKFARLLVEKLNVNSSPGGTRVAAVYYSSESRRAFDVGDYSTSKTVARAIEQTVKYMQKGTNLPAALDDVRNMMAEDFALSVQNNKNPANRKKVLFIITDGMSNVGGGPVEHAMRLKQEFNITIHCIGISRNTPKTALAEIASDPTSEHVFFLDSYKSLDHAVAAITNANISYDTCGIAGTALSGRIVGGNISSSGAWPWQVALYDEDKNEIVCGGTLIHKNWVLTAAHCFGNKTGEVLPEKTTVILGMTHRTRDEKRVQEFDVQELIIHPEYRVSRDKNYYNDIALLRLNREAMLNPFVRTICLPPNTNNKNANWFVNPQRYAVVTGWGHHSYEVSKRKLSLELREVTISPVLDSLCTQQYENVDTEVAFCAGAQYRDSCQGDSGGPLMVKGIKGRRAGSYRQIGIVSYGRGCGDGPGVYTRLTYFVDWVKENTGIV